MFSAKSKLQCSIKFLLHRVANGLKKYFFSDTHFLGKIKVALKVDQKWIFFQILLASSSL